MADSDASLVRMAATGHASAFAELMRRHFSTGGARLIDMTLTYPAPASLARIGETQRCDLRRVGLGSGYYSEFLPVGSIQAAEVVSLCCFALASDVEDAVTLALGRGP